MEEVLEMACIINNKDVFFDIRKNFIEVFDNEIISEKIEIMDNWCYDNSFVMKSYLENNIKKYIENKIVLITSTTKMGNIGLHIERISQEYWEVVIWLKEKENNNKFSELVQGITKNNINKMILIAIGKEIVFEYSDNFYKMDKNSHNIDRWILFKEYHNSKYIKMYIKYEVTEPTRDGRIDMIVKKQV